MARDPTLLIALCLMERSVRCFWVLLFYAKRKVYSHTHCNQKTFIAGKVVRQRIQSPASQPFYGEGTHRKQKTIPVEKVEGQRLQAHTHRSQTNLSYGEGGREKSTVTLITAKRNLPYEKASEQGSKTLSITLLIMHDNWLLAFGNHSSEEILTFWLYEKLNVISETFFLACNNMSWE